MDYKTFSVKILELAQVYGEKSFPKKRTDMIWKTVNEMNDNDFSRFCDNWIRDNVRAPMGQDFQFFKDKIFYSNKHSDTDLNERYELMMQGKICKYCDDGGFVEAHNLHTKQIFAFKCGECSFGKNKKVKCATWNLDMNHLWQVIPLTKYISDDHEYEINKIEREKYLSEMRSGN